MQNKNGCLHDPNTGWLNGDRRMYKWKFYETWGRGSSEKEKKGERKTSKQTNKQKETVIEHREKSRIRRHRDYGKNGTFIILLVIIILLPIIIHFFFFLKRKDSLVVIHSLSVSRFFLFLILCHAIFFWCNQALPLTLLQYMHDNSARASSMLIDSRSFWRRRSRYIFENHISVCHPRGLEVGRRSRDFAAPVSLV